MGLIPGLPAVVYWYVKWAELETSLGSFFACVCAMVMFSFDASTPNTLPPSLANDYIYRGLCNIVITIDYRNIQ